MMDAQHDVNSEQYRVHEIKRFSQFIILAAVVLALIPTIYAIAVRSGESMYLGHQTSLDDHMHYASWMRQAMDGNILFDNRFTTDEQPGLTFHLYFLVLGWLASFSSILLVDLVARVLFGILFLVLLSRLLIKHQVPIFVSKFALALVIFGSGLGAIVWQNFGREATNAPAWAKAIFGPWLPIDVWQPEAFVFPSLLTNGLFLASGCLILLIVDALISSKDDPKRVWIGGVAMLLLMNIHSYDVLLLGLVAIGFLAIQVGARDVTVTWVARVFIVFLFVLPAAAWFLYVLRNDPVFQARAATETYSGTFRQTMFGIFPAMVLASLQPILSDNPKRKIGIGIFLGMALVLYFFSGRADPSQYFLSLPAWLVVFAICLAALSQLGTGDRFKNFLWAWAVIGLVAPYFPALFQRKLGMLLIVPWAILAAYGLANILQRLDRQPRNLVAALALVVTCIGSLLWMQREFAYIRHNVASTTVHPVFLSSEVEDILQALDEIDGRKVVIAMPGIPSPQEGAFAYTTPYIPDLAPIISGFTGSYSYAGHWSETPDFNERRAEVAVLFLTSVTDAEIWAFLEANGVTHIVAPVPETFSMIPLRSMESFGTSLTGGRQFQLIRVER